MTCQGTVDVSTRGGGSDASLLAQQLDGCLALGKSLRISMRVRLSAILYMDELLCDLGTFSLHLFSAGRRHSSTVVDLLRLI